MNALSMGRRVSAWCCAAATMLAGTATVLGVSPTPAAATTTFNLIGPAGTQQFGLISEVLPNGNFFVTDSSYDSATQTNVGAVFLYDGATNALISTLTGSRTNDSVAGYGVVVLPNSNFVVVSPFWNDGVGTAVGAVTWVNGTTGLNGVVSPSNSLVGSTSNDRVGGTGVEVLTNGSYVVQSADWDNGSAVDAGAATWGSGTAGVSGAVSSANSIVGSQTDDRVGFEEVTALPNGNYVVASSRWRNGSAASAGAVTWGNGATGTAGVVSAANSLVGSSPIDIVGGTGVFVLTNGNYVVRSYRWDNGALTNAGAVTWGSGTTGISGPVSVSNSLVGTKNSDGVGGRGVLPLTNGNYLVLSTEWDNGAGAEAGAVTWANGTTGLIGPVTTANSLVGTATLDEVGKGYAIALTNGNYVVGSPAWHNGLIDNAGAVTWGNGATGTSGVVSASNSLVGSTSGDRLGDYRIKALSNGNYVVASPTWDSATASNAGAVTWGSGTVGVIGVVSSANSLIGSQTDDFVGIDGGGPVVLPNGNYVVASPDWDNGAVRNVGAVTWANGATGLTGFVSSSNSLIGSTRFDYVGNSGVTVLTNGGYVVNSPDWDSGAIADAGAATWGGPTGVRGAVSSSNSLVGTSVGDAVGLASTVALTNGNYVVNSPRWDNGPATNAGAITWGSGTSGVVGSVSIANSLIGSTLDDFIGNNEVTAFPNGNYVVASPSWDNGTTVDAGAATWGSGTTGVRGALTPANSLVGSMAYDEVGSGVGMSSIIVLENSDYVVASPRWDNGAIVDAGAMTYGPSAGVVGPVTTSNSAVGTPPGQVRSVDTRLTSSRSILVGTQQNRVLLFELPDVIPPTFAGTPPSVSATAAPPSSTAVVTYPTPVATDNGGPVTVNCVPASGSAFAIGNTAVQCTATDGAGLTSITSFTVTVSPGAVIDPAPRAEYVPLVPARLVDTRIGAPTVDGQLAGIGRRAAGSTIEVPVAGRGGVAGDARAVALNVTSVDAAGGGYATVFPCGSPQPTASNLNYTPGSNVPNAVIAKLPPSGKVCIFVYGATDLIVDVSGYFPTTTSLLSMNPARLYDTRPGSATIDGSGLGGGARVAGSTAEIQVTGRVGVPSDAVAVVLNVTVDLAAETGFLTVYPCGTPLPDASNLNYVKGTTRADVVIAKVGAGGKVCVYSAGATHLIADIGGYFPSVTGYSSLDPARLLDTRPGTSTIDRRDVGGGLRAAGSTTELSVIGRGGVPTGATTVVLNATATEPTQTGFVTVYPCGVTRPVASNLNFNAGGTVANAVLVKVGAGGKICIYNSDPTQIIVDVAGYFVD
jgi:trimeric autotransporter adhesin